jgi:hypothetical protein
VFAGLSLLVLLAVYGIGNTRWQLIAVAVGGLFVCLAACLGVGRLLPRYYAMRLFIVGYALQLSVLVAIAALGLPLSPGYHPFEVNAADAPLRVVLSILTVPVGALLAALTWRFVSRQSPGVEKPDAPDAIAKQRRVYLVIAAFAQLLYWPAARDTSGVAGYVVRVVVAALMVAPFLAGRDSRRDRGLASLWWLVILVDLVVGIAAGSRAKALGVAVFFTAGYISALPRGRRLAVGACAGLALVPLLQFAGALGVVRDELGRGGLELATTDHIRDVFTELSREMTPGSQQNAEAINTQGLGRILAWTNVVVPIMTPETIPYRGLNGFFDEAVDSFHIASLSGLTADDLYDALLFNSPARLYGFTINSNTSVEFSLTADAWSRGGAPVALIFSFIAAFALMACEAGAYRFRRYPMGVATILALPVVKGALDAAGVPLLSMLRDMILNLILVAVGVAVVELTRHAGRKVGQPRVAGPLRSSEGTYHRA